MTLRTHEYNTKEIKLKKNVDPTLYLRMIPVELKEHYINIQKQTNNVTRVNFQNVPYNVPDR